jgi:hypothetical protein
MWIWWVTRVKMKTVTPHHGEFVGVMNKPLLKTMGTHLMIMRTLTAVRCATSSLDGFRVFKGI